VLLVGGTDTSSRHWSPASPLSVPHSRGPRPGSPEVLGMGLRPCGPQVVEFSWSPQLLDLFYVERQLDLSSVAARLRVGKRSLKWLIVETEVVEEMIRRRTLSV
ncbi:hypothetical protein Taro_005561, partial [Colocasia esculenta]|nr:hypothetical protein [Colocasia esculenta]